MDLGANDLLNAAQGLKDSSELADLAIETAAGLAPKVSNNLLKAIWHLFSCKMDLYVAKAERAPALERASTASQVALTLATSRKIAEKIQISNDDVKGVTENFIARALGREINLERVVTEGVRQLRTEPRFNSSGSNQFVSDRELSFDWLNAFAAEAEKMHSEHMQYLFGCILAGEIKQPGCCSIKTLRVLSEMDQKTAESFIKICSMVIQTEGLDGSVESFVLFPPDGGGIFSGGPIKEFYDLVEMGLIRLLPDSTTLSNYLSDAHKSEEKKKIKSTMLEINIQGGVYSLDISGVPKKELNLFESTFFDGASNAAAALNSYALTKIGKELFSIVDVPINNEYVDYLKESFNKDGVVFKKKS